ncbi:MAG: nucleotide exchange factor GrpE [Actinobacteria bacterium]|nr:nucleotide exchange factor GrpE [Actinomycetota bacterium]MCI0543689.1 nucleotide exchange factor GrpE [Actinomycetota bacterium]MCI0679429.1 nucleotide exchange factor GrpE [Actinomycetota bacterium]
MSEPTRGEREESLPAEANNKVPDPHSLGLELPEAPDDAIALLLTELGTARDEASSYLDDLRRVAADFDNYRKRTMKETAAILDRATERVVQGLMPVLDSFDAGLNTEPGTETERLLYSGLLNTREQLLKSLEAEGLEVIPTVGEPFNPALHEPVEAPAGTGRLIVKDELRRGYKLRDRVLRPALVSLEARG